MLATIGVCHVQWANNSYTIYILVASGYRMPLATPMPSVSAAKDYCLVIVSLSLCMPLTIAIGPPSWASGATWPMTKPCDAPENLPSVIKAHWPPSPAPMRAPVGVNISGMPGPPFGPSYRITTTVPWTYHPCTCKDLTESSNMRHCEYGKASTALVMSQDSLIRSRQIVWTCHVQ